MLPSVVVKVAISSFTRIKYRVRANILKDHIYCANLPHCQGSPPGLVFVPTLFLSGSDHVEGPMKHLLKQSICCCYFVFPAVVFVCLFFL